MAFDLMNNQPFLPMLFLSLSTAMYIWLLMPPCYIQSHTSRICILLACLFASYLCPYRGRLEAKSKHFLLLCVFLETYN